MSPFPWPTASPEVMAMDDETKRRAFVLRQQGKSWRAIADELHYDYTHLFREVVKAAKGGKRPHDRLG